MSSATLVYLGVGLLIVGIGAHFRFMRGLREERATMAGHGLIHAQSRYPGSYTLVVALPFLVVGLAALVNLSFRIGPFD